jgi:ABC-type sugar transport system ATPase subunit
MIKNSDKSLFELQGITKIYPGVVALDNVSFDLKPGEVHVLCGENGAGKSTLIKIMSGAEFQDAGTIIYQGNERVFKDPQDAQRSGVATIYQEFNLIPEMSIAQNLFLGREPKKFFNSTIDWKKVWADAEKYFDMIGVKLDVREKIKNISVSRQQLVEIAKALSLNAKVIIFDEPTSTLTDEDAKRLFKIIEQLKNQGIGIIYISHRLEELFQIGTRVSVLRDGKKIAEHSIKEVTKQQIISEMVGRTLDKEYERNIQQPGKEMLRVENLTSGSTFRNINFYVRQKEIIGFSGLVGAGRTEVMRAVFGIDKFDNGTIYLKGKKYFPKKPKASVRHKIAFIPEDRKNEGLCLDLSVRENIIHASMGSLFKDKIVNSKKEISFVDHYVKELKIKTPTRDQIVKNLSGGNQQKVVLAKWLLTQAEIFIFDEPTRGIDVGAKAEFHILIDKLVTEGAAVILISSELPEVLGMSDRIYVMKEGSLVEEFSRDEATQENVIRAAIG